MVCPSDYKSVVVPTQNYHMQNVPAQYVPRQNNPMKNVPRQYYPTKNDPNGFTPTNDQISNIGGNKFVGYSVDQIEFYPTDWLMYKQKSSSNTISPVPYWNNTFDPYPGWIFTTSGYYKYKISVDSNNSISWFAKIWTRNSTTIDQNNKYYGPDHSGSLVPTGQIRSNSPNKNITLDGTIYINGRGDKLYAVFTNNLGVGIVGSRDIKESTYFNISLQSNGQNT